MASSSDSATNPPPDMPVMTDAEFEKALEGYAAGGGNDNPEDVNELIKMMNEQRIITWEETEKILMDAEPNKVIKSGLPEQVRPSEPDNNTNVDECIRKATENDPSLTQVNLNNMKRTPIPQIQRLIYALANNTYVEKLYLANVGLTDSAIEPLIELLKWNETLLELNLETNYLTGEYLSRLFKAALVKQSVEQIKCVNQGMTFSTQSEREIIDAIDENRRLVKVSINLRLPEGRHKIENAVLRNVEIRRVLRKQAAAEEKLQKEEQVKVETPKKTAPATPKKPETPKKTETPKRTETPRKTEMSKKVETPKKAPVVPPKTSTAKKTEPIAKK